MKNVFKLTKSIIYLEIFIQFNVQEGAHALEN